MKSFCSPGLLQLLLFVFLFCFPFSSGSRNNILKFSTFAIIKFVKSSLQQITLIRFDDILDHLTSSYNHFGGGVGWEFLSLPA